MGSGISAGTSYLQPVELPFPYCLPSHSQPTPPSIEPTQPTAAIHTALVSPTNTQPASRTGIGLVRPRKKLGRQAEPPLPIPSHMPLKSAEDVLKKYEQYLNSKQVGIVAAKLARNTFFGESVLKESSVSGTEDTRPLDPQVLNQLKAAIRQKFVHTTQSEFDLMWRNCLDSLSRLCTYCRRDAK